MLLNETSNSEHKKANSIDSYKKKNEYYYFIKYYPNHKLKIQSNFCSIKDNLLYLIKYEKKKLNYMSNIIENVKNLNHKKEKNMNVKENLIEKKESNMNEKKTLVKKKCFVIYVIAIISF